MNCAFHKRIRLNIRTHDFVEIFFDDLFVALRENLFYLNMPKHRGAYDDWAEFPTA